jgi:hypothetical protein
MDIYGISVGFNGDLWDLYGFVGLNGDLMVMFVGLNDLNGDLY